MSTNKKYKFGDVIFTYDQKIESFQTIKIPAYNIGGDNSQCMLNEPVKFLNSKSIKCLRTISELCSYNNGLMSQLINSQLFRRPSKSYAASSTNEEASVETFNVVVESCKHSLDSFNCSQISVPFLFHEGNS